MRAAGVSKHRRVLISTIEKQYANWIGRQASPSRVGSERAERASRRAKNERKNFFRVCYRVVRRRKAACAWLKFEWLADCKKEGITKKLVCVRKVRTEDRRSA